MRYWPYCHSAWVRRDLAQIETIYGLVDLPLFQIPQGDDVEEGILLFAFLGGGVLNFQVNVLLDEHPLRMGLGGIYL